MEVSEARRLKALEEENSKLKKLLAEQMFDGAAPQEHLSTGRRASEGAASLNE
jgi:putative transposase